MINCTKVVCLCGSTRFTKEMLMKAWELAKQGIIPIGWSVLPTNHNADGEEIDHHLAEKEGVTEILDELHLRKIDLADEVLVINVDGYIGEATAREIVYALKNKKKVSFIEPQHAYPEIIKQLQED